MVGHSAHPKVREVRRWIHALPRVGVHFANVPPSIQPRQKRHALLPAGKGRAAHFQLHVLHTMSEHRQPLNVSQITVGVKLHAQQRHGCAVVLMRLGVAIQGGAERHWSSQALEHLGIRQERGGVTTFQTAHSLFQLRDFGLELMTHLLQLRYRRWR